MSAAADQPMGTETELAYEARVRMRQAVIAGLAALLTIAASAVQFAGTQIKVSEITAQLVTVHKRFPLDLIASILEALALVAVISTLSFLFRAARARRPELAPAQRMAAVIGGSVSAVVGIAVAVILAVKASDFVNHGAQTYEQAHQLTSVFALQGLQTLQLLAQFVLPLGLILIALNAMRVGLLTRFMGYFGVMVGVIATPIATIFFGPSAIALEVFWLIAVAYLFTGRWPNGDPPAWRSGRAEPWPSSVEMREQRMKSAAGGGGSRGAGRGPAAREPAGRGASGRGREAETGRPAENPARTRSSTPKRKRKKRR